MDEENVVYAYKVILFRQKKSEILQLVMAWMDLGDIMLGEIRQLQKDKQWTIFFFYEASNILICTERANRMVVTRG